jgi:hypothetical protein
MTALETRALLRSNEWRGLDSRNAQVTFLYEFCQIHGSTRFTNRDVGMIFNIREHRVRSIHYKALIKKKPPYRPLALELQQEEVVQFVRNGFAFENYVTQCEILNYVEQNFGKTLTYGWLRTFRNRHERKSPERSFIDKNK